MDFPIIQKPPYRSACNRCGECCRHQACEASIQLLHSEQAPCVALEISANGETRCGLMTRPHFYLGLAWSADDCKKVDEFFAPMIGKYLGIGQGCGMEDEQ